MSKLDDAAVKGAKARDKAYKLADAGGFYLLVLPSGSRLWRLDYRHNGRRKTLAIGTYPAMKLDEARKSADAAKALLATGIDPSARKKADRVAAEAQRTTFAEMSDEYLARLAETGGRQHKEGTTERASDGTMKRNRWLLDNLGKDLRSRSIIEITPGDVLSVVQKAEASGRRESAHRLRALISNVFDLAIALQRTQNNPAYPLRKALKPVITKSQPAITDEKRFAALYDTLYTYDGWPTLRAILIFEALTVPRPVEARFAEWTHFDLTGGVWRIPAQRMKMRGDHEVALSRQAVAILEEVRAFSGKCRLVFPSIRDDDRPLSENAMNSALRRMGYTQAEHVAHGFRSSFSTIMNERGHDPELIEISLAHYDNSVRGIYNRARYWPGRVKVMQDWADLLDELRRPTRPPPSPSTQDFADLL